MPPPAPKAAAGEQKTKAAELNEDLADLTKQLRSQTETQVDAKPAAAKDGAAPAKQGGADEEPEDFL